MKITYQVNVDVDKSIETEWVSWMSEKHIPEVCEAGHVADALMIKYNDNAVEKHANFRIIYLYDNKEDLDNYLENHAETMRNMHAEKFGTNVTISRRVGVLLKWYERA
jgi:hypothetical protein